MALLGSYIDSRIKTWHINRKSFIFEHGLPEKPDYVIICPIGIKSKCVKFGFKIDKKKV